MAEEEQTKRFEWDAILAMIGVGIVCLNKLADFDYWTHLAFGGEFLAQKSIHIDEPFLASLAGQPIDSTEWPFQILLYIVHASSSHAGVSIFISLLAMATFWIITRSLPSEEGDSRRTVGLILLAVAFFCARGRYQPRPEVLVFLFFALSLHLSFVWTKSPTVKALAALTVLFAVWWQLHVSWSIGAAFTLLVMVFSPRPRWWVDALKDPRRSPLVALFLCGAAISVIALANFGYHVLSGMGQSGRMIFIAEMRPLWEWPDAFIPFSIVALLSLVAALLATQGRFLRLLFWAAASTLAILAARNYALGILLTAIIGIAGLKNAKPFGPFLGRRSATALTLALVVILVGFASRSKETPIGLGLDKSIDVSNSLAFLQTTKIPEPLFNTFEIGGGLDYGLRGKPRTFIDGRSLGGDKHIADFREAVESASPTAVLERLGTRTVVAKALFRNSGRVYPLVFRLLTDARWKLVHASDALVFVKADSLGDLAAIPSYDGWKFIRREAEMLGETTPDAEHIPYTIGVTEVMTRNPGGAQEYFAEGVRRYPDHQKYYANFIQISKMAR